MGLARRVQTSSLIPLWAEDALRASHPPPLVGQHAALLHLRIAGHLRPGRDQQTDDVGVLITAADVQRQIEGVFRHSVAVLPHDVTTWNPPYYTRSLEL